MKYPRTMQEAFGPYVNHELMPIRDKTPLEILHERMDRVILVLSIVTTAWLLLTCTQP